MKGVCINAVNFQFELGGTIFIRGDSRLSPSTNQIWTFRGDIC